MIVYLITNTINGKRYVGQTIKTLEWRWKNHLKVARSNYICSAVAAAIRKYGPENFGTEVICEPPTLELMNELESEYINRYCTLAPNGYNLMSGGAAPRHSPETRKKLSVAATGRIPSEETRQKMRLASPHHSKNKGRKHSEETRKKVSLASTGRFHTPETIQKMRLVQSNRSEDWCRKISESKKGKCEGQRARRAREKNARHRSEDSSPRTSTCE